MNYFVGKHSFLPALDPGPTVHVDRIYLILGSILSQSSKIQYQTKNSKNCPYFVLPGDRNRSSVEFFIKRGIASIKSDSLNGTELLDI